MKKRILLIIFIAACAALLFACRNDKGSSESSIPPSVEAEKKREFAVETMIDTMTDEEKVGQLFMISLDGGKDGPALAVTGAIRDIINTYKPGGVFFMDENIQTREQVKAFISDLKSCSTFPMFIAAEEEGGDLSPLAKIGYEKKASAAEIGDTDNPDNPDYATSYAYEVMSEIGKELKELGFNFNLAPLCNVKSDEKNYIWGSRAYSSSAVLTADLANTAAQALRDNKIIPVLKYFPGIGEVSAYTDKGAVKLNLDFERLYEKGIRVFEKGISYHPCIMTSHVSLPTLLDSNIPQSLSEEMIQNFLRDQLTFTGIVMTDSLRQKAITKYYKPGEAAVLAVKAGNDLLFMPEDFAKAYNAVLKAVKDGEISALRLDMSLRRILYRKYDFGIWPETE